MVIKLKIDKVLNSDICNTCAHYGFYATEDATGLPIVAAYCSCLDDDTITMELIDNFNVLKPDWCPGWEASTDLLKANQR